MIYYLLLISINYLKCLYYNNKRYNKLQHTIFNFESRLKDCTFKKKLNI